MRAPVIINSTTLNKDFSFLVKIELGVYEVYDYLKSLGYRIKRELPGIEFKNSKDAELFAETVEVLGYSCKQFGNRILFVDPEHEEYEDVDLPLYKKDDKYGIRYSYLNTSYCLEGVPTLETVKRANSYYDLVYQELKKAHLIADVEMKIDMSVDFVSTILDTREDVSKILDNNEYLVFHIYKPYGTNVKYKTLIISKERAKSYVYNGVLSILVPKEIAGLIIGKGGKNCKAMAEELGVKNICIDVIKK